VLTTAATRVAASSRTASFTLRRVVVFSSSALCRCWANSFVYRSLSTNRPATACSPIRDNHNACVASQTSTPTP